jgi:hypothetical protein
MFKFFENRRKRLQKAKSIRDELTFVEEQLSAPHVQAYLNDHPEELAEIESIVSSIHSKMAGPSTFKA